MFGLTGKKALVTGSTQGIGLAVAKLLAGQGATVFVHGATSLEKCRRACEEVPGGIPVLADLGEPDCADTLYRQTGDVDILVLNASVQYKTKWNEITYEAFRRQTDVNFGSSLALMQVYVPYMQKQGWGRIVTVGSVNQYKQHPDLAVYAATKSAQLNLAENMARQLAPFGITVNNIAPGVIDTPRNSAALSDATYRAAVMQKIPCGYAGEPEDIAPAVLLLCSEEGRYITGADIPIDGGMRL